MRVLIACAIAIAPGSVLARSSFAAAKAQGVSVPPHPIDRGVALFPRRHVQVGPSSIARTGACPLCSRRSTPVRIRLRPPSTGQERRRRIFIACDSSSFVKQEHISFRLIVSIIVPA
jgi:hypothetical protein